MRKNRKKPKFADEVLPVIADKTTGKNKLLTKQKKNKNI